MAPRQTTPLPLSRTWLTHSAAETFETDREAVLAGKAKKPGTKAHLRSMLLNAGWEVDVVDAVITGRVNARSHLVDLDQEQRAEFDFNAAAARLKDRGFNAQFIDKQLGSSVHVQETWDSLTRFPWWAAALRGQRSLAIVGKTQVAAARASACFVRDVWVNLGEAPVQRMPSVQRINLLSFASADAIARFREHIAPTAGVIVVSGLETADLVYQMFGYAGALSSVAPHAVLVYEAVPAPDVSTSMLLSAAQRSGFSFVLGVRRG